jgi:hypothetical protein
MNQAVAMHAQDGTLGGLDQEGLSVVLSEGQLHDVGQVPGLGLGVQVVEM